MSVARDVNLVRYGKHAPIMDGTPCNVCGIKHAKPVVDHCHKHGWVRETLCRRCNTLMALIDRKINPHAGGAGQVTLLGLLMHFALCPDCPPLTVDDLKESGTKQIAFRLDLTDVRRLAEVETDGNVSLMIRKLLTEALAARAKQAR